MSQFAIKTVFWAKIHNENWPSERAMNILDFTIFYRCYNFGEIYHLLFEITYIYISLYISTANQRK